MTPYEHPLPPDTVATGSNPTLTKGRAPGIERIRVWQCIGCGKIDAPEPCIGVCEDRAQEMVYAADYDALATEAAALRAVVLRIAGVTPREGAWKESWKALKVYAERTLAATRSGTTGTKP